MAIQGDGLVVVLDLAHSDSTDLGRSDSTVLAHSGSIVLAHSDSVGLPNGVSGRVSVEAWAFQEERNLHQTWD